MEKIFRVDTDDQEKIDLFVEKLKELNGSIVIPQGESIKLWIVSDSEEEQERLRKEIKKGNFKLISSGNIGIGT